MAKRKLSRIERIILVAFITSSLTFLGFWWNNKKVNRDFFLPANYEGWVTIHYEMPDAPALPEVGGIQQIIIPDNGILRTSTKLEIGWRRDQFFWGKPGNAEAIPSLVQTGDEPALHIHQHQYFSWSHMQVAPFVRPGNDTTLSDKTKIERSTRGFVTYVPGRKRVEQLYLTPSAQGLSFTPPQNEGSMALESVESREVQIPVEKMENPDSGSGQ